MELDVEKQLEHSHPLALGSHPWLLISHKGDKRVQTFFSISESHGSSRRLPDMSNKIFCICSHGWFVLLDADSEDCFLLHPISLEKIQLPPLTLSDWHFCVLTLALDNPNELEYQILCAIGYEGNIYAIDSEIRNKVGLLQVNPGSGMSLLREGLPMPSQPKYISTYQTYMVESCGEVFVVKSSCWEVYKPRVRYFENFKVNVSTGDWKKVEDLEDHAFFIDTKSRIKKNSIYYTGRWDKVSSPCPGVNFHDYKVAWIMSTPTMSCSPNSYDEENTLAVVEDIIPKIRNTMEEEINYEEGNTIVVVENTITKIRNTMEEEMEVQQVPWSWADLPQDLLSLIQSYLFAGDRICFHAVCKAWQKSSKVSLPLDSMDYAMMASSPCLMSFSTKGNINLFYPMYNNRCTLKLEEELFASIELPDFLHDGGFDPFCFTSTPTSIDCIVFGILSDCKKVKIFITRVGEERWNVYHPKNKKRLSVFSCINMSVSVFSMSFIPSQSNSVFYGGLFYCLDEEVGVLCPEHLGDSMYVSGYDQNFLVECDGSLLAVFVGTLGRWIRVCRLDQSKMILKDVNSLEDWMLFLSESTYFSMKAAVRGMGNKIYIPRFYGNHGVFYSHATKRYHTFDGGYCWTDFYGSTEEIQCTWML
ncbi:hypothetical protein NE237_019203 [Protea cynaroides]|uniref:KIB1-4 beta-propeller domain-containing protein n=1 Tax=Protea cynaroides TaxID=273540 RepID=A0A9Q0KBF9_9MAGN|nr:hypothetical protein NE237_019203 [Protea cynaroides]